MIKYLGSKRLLIASILETIKSAHPRANSVIDLFSGTSRVGHALKAKGYLVHSNDHNIYAYHLANCYVAADASQVEGDAWRLIKELNTLKGEPGYFTEKFCQNARFFHPKNGERVDSIREYLSRLDLPPKLFSVCLISLMEAADRVDSTCGLQMAYLKSWAKRAHNELELRMPRLLNSGVNGPSDAFCQEALCAAQALRADVAYLDPPYNQHSYLSNYHIWETLAKWDKPESYGIAQKRIDCKTIRSPFNSKTRFCRLFFRWWMHWTCQSL